MNGAISLPETQSLPWVAKYLIKKIWKEKKWPMAWSTKWKLMDILKILLIPFHSTAISSFFWSDLIIKKQPFRKTENSKFHKVQKTAYLKKCVAIYLKTNKKLKFSHTNYSPWIPITACWANISWHDLTC